MRNLVHLASALDRLLISIAFTSGVAACAGAPSVSGPIVDMTGVDSEKYHVDLNACHGYADEVRTGKQVVAGAASNAVIWGAIGAIYGGADGASKSGASGAVWGGARGAGKATSERNRVVKSCLRYRGYAVLN